MNIYDYNNGLSNDPNGTTRKMEGFCKATTPIPSDPRDPSSAAVALHAEILSWFWQSEAPEATTRLRKAMESW
jgi:hypothetical protein